MGQYQYVYFLPEDSPVPPRYSRHMYDMACMADNPVKDRAMSRLDLLQTVADFKSERYAQTYARFD